MTMTHYYNLLQSNMIPPSLLPSNLTERCTCLTSLMLLLNKWIQKMRIFFMTLTPLLTQYKPMLLIPEDHTKIGVNRTLVLTTTVLQEGTMHACLPTNGSIFHKRIDLLGTVFLRKQKPLFWAYILHLLPPPRLGAPCFMICQPLISSKTSMRLPLNQIHLHLMTPMMTNSLSMLRPPTNIYPLLISAKYSPLPSPNCSLPIHHQTCRSMDLHTARLIPTTHIMSLNTNNHILPHLLTEVQMEALPAMMSG